MPSFSSQSSLTDEYEGEDDYSQYMPLYKAAIKGDWESAKRFLDGDQSAATAVINEIGETVLHVAVSVGRRNVNTHFVKELLKLIPSSELAYLNNIWGRTTLHNAAIFGNIEAAKLLVEHNPYLANIHNGGWTPIQFAAAFDQKEMVSYLMTVTIADEDPFPFANKAGFDLLTSMITSEFYDLALQLVQCYPSLATWAPSGQQIALYTLAGKPSAFPSGRVPVKFKNDCNKPSGEDVEKGENTAESFQVHARMSSWVPFFISDVGC
ncbi:hypothetical protein L1049_008257 [Liquidambar formosana]|uniref:Uncharacterized protein n=1 Tax=Liquidambar formosana TaxID=63359 RepID=A0AAP0X864_LIQFO